MTIKRTAVVALLLLIITTYVFSNNANAIEIDFNLEEDELAAVFFSIPNNEIVLLQLDNGENILICSHLELGSSSLLDQWLKLFNVHEIQTLILTKMTNHSIYFLKDVSQKYNVKQLLTGKTMYHYLKNHLHLMDDLSLQSWSEEKSVSVHPSVNMKVIHENEDFSQGLDLSVRFQNHHMFLLNSNGKQSEQVLLKKHLNDVNILKISDFGSNNSISDQLLKHIDPQVSVIFESESKKLSNELIEKLYKIWVDTYLTRNHGTILVKFTKYNYEIKTIPKNVIQS